MGAAIVSVRVSEEDREALEKLASVTGKSKSSLVAEAIRSYVELNAWQMSVVRQRLEVADRQEYASRERVRAVFAKWGVDAD
ncbi:MAG: CopG family ribbon-helix-helix protein [Sulfuricellaceae bacterium]